MVFYGAAGRPSVSLPSARSDGGRRADARGWLSRRDRALHHLPRWTSTPLATDRGGHAGPSAARSAAIFLRIRIPRMMRATGSALVSAFETLRITPAHGFGGTPWSPAGRCARTTTRERACREFRVITEETGTARSWWCRFYCGRGGGPALHQQSRAGAFTERRDDCCGSRAGGLAIQNARLFGRQEAGAPRPRPSPAKDEFSRCSATAANPLGASATPPTC